MCRTLRRALEDEVTLSLAIQTNGILLDAAWADVLAEHRVQIGVSLDGPADVNDLARVDHRGIGSHARVERALGLLRERHLPFTILCVVQPGSDPLRVHRHFLELGATEVAYLLPTAAREEIEMLRERFGQTPCADFLIPIFDHWWFKSEITFRIREFWNMGRVIMGGDSHLDSIGNPPLCFVAVETDGAMEGLDKLRTCEDGMTAIGLNVLDADFRDIPAHNAFHAAAMAGLPLPTACRECPEATTCGGGYLPHRYVPGEGFDHPSIWCADLLRMFSHIRDRMGITPAETARRREELVRSRATAAEPQRQHTFS
jgi:uncharacterized protein